MQTGWSAGIIGGYLKLYEHNIRVYVGFCMNEKVGKKLEEKVLSFMPSKGSIRTLFLSDQQFKNQKVFYSGIKKLPEQNAQYRLL